MYVSHTPSPIIISIFPSFGQLIFAQQFFVVFLLKGFWCERLDTASSLSSNVNLPNARILHQAQRGTTDDGHRVSGLLLLLSHIWVHTSALPKTSTYHPPMPYLRGDAMVLFFHTHSLPLSLSLLSKCKWKEEIPLISLTLERRQQMIVVSRRTRDRAKWGGEKLRYVKDPAQSTTQLNAGQAVSCVEESDFLSVPRGFGLPINPSLTPAMRLME